MTVTVALNGGLFETAKTAAEGTKIEGEKEQLLSITLGALNNKGKVDFEKLDDTLEGTDFEGEDGVYTSTKTGKKYEVGERGSVTEKPVLKISPKKATYTVGEEVTIGSEHFYVIANTTDTVTLLAKYNIKADGTSWIQDATGATNACAYIATADTISAPDKAEKYGEKYEVEGVIGRLPTLSDIHALGGYGDDSSAGSTTDCYGFINSTDKGGCKFWLSSVSTLNSSYQMVVDGQDDWGRILNDSADGSFGLTYGIRPVLVVSKSAI